MEQEDLGDPSGFGRALLAAFTDKAGPTKKKKKKGRTPPNPAISSCRSIIARGPGKIYDEPDAGDCEQARQGGCEVPSPIRLGKKRVEIPPVGGLPETDSVPRVYAR